MRVLLVLFALLSMTISAACQARSAAPFQPRPPVAIGGKPADLALADLNSDGKLDVIVADEDQDGVTVLLGDGRGGLALHGTFPALDKAHLVAVADVNGDRKLDVAASAHDSDSVALLLGEGNGRLAAARMVPIFQSRKAHNHGLALADVNNDGAADLLVSHQDENRLAVLLNDKRGNFTPAPGSPFPTGRSPYPHTVAEITGDGHLDVVLPAVTSNRIDVLRGDGSGRFTLAPEWSPAVRERPFYAAVRDLNGDRRPDVVATHDDTSVLSILLAQARGFAPAREFSANQQGWRVALFEAGGGRHYAAIGSGRGVAVFTVDPQGNFAAAPGSPIETGGGTWAVRAGDLDGDGRADLVAASQDAGTVAVLLAR